MPKLVNAGDYGEPNDMKNKVLIVDDEYQVRRLLRRVLEELGHDVIEAEDGDEAAQLARREQPALVLLDMHMPRTEGIAALDEILASDPGIAVIMVSADCDWDRVKLAMERGVWEYITKPLDLQELGLSITSNLERRRARQAAEQAKRERRQA